LLNRFNGARLKYKGNAIAPSVDRFDVLKQAGSCFENFELVQLNL
jgi:hypothetical protein